MAHQDYHIIYNPLTYNLMDLMGRITDPIEIVSYLTQMDARRLNKDNYLDYLQFDVKKHRVGMADLFAIESYAALYVGNQIADATPNRRVVHCDGRRRTLRETIARYGTRPKAVFITSMSSNFPTAVAAALVLNYAEIPVIFGGIHVSTSPEDIDTFIRAICPHPELITQVIGAGDRQTIARICADLESRQLQREYFGYTIVENGVWGPRDNVELPPPMQIDTLARIPLIGRYLASKIRIIPAAPFLGCPYSCNFCSISTLPKKHRKLTIRDTGDFLDELEAMQNSGGPDSRFFFFLPDNLMLGAEKLDGILQGIIDRKLKINFAAQISIDIASNDHLLKRLRQAGATHFFIGLESLDLRNLEYIGKHIVGPIKSSGLSATEYYARQIRKIQSYGISIHGAFIFGLPFDYCRSAKENTAVEVGNFCVKNKIGLQPASLTDLPGSKNYAESQRDGLWLYGKRGTIEYLLGLCLTDLSEMNRRPPDSLDNCPLTVAYLAYEAIQKAAGTRHVLYNALYAFYKSFRYPTQNGRDSFKERIVDSFYSSASQLVVALYKELGDKLSYSGHGLRGSFERLYDEYRDTSSAMCFDHFIRQFREIRPKRTT